MIIGIPKETHQGEQRIAFIPSSVDRLVKKGAQIIIETGLGASIGISDEEYKKAGASTESNRHRSYLPPILSFACASRPWKKSAF